MQNEKDDQIRQMEQVHNDDLYKATTGVEQREK
jgi:hypothetical protein